MRPQIAFLQKGLFKSSVFWPILFVSWCHVDVFLQNKHFDSLDFLTAWRWKILFSLDFQFRLMSTFFKMAYDMFHVSDVTWAMKIIFCGYTVKFYNLCSFFTYIKRLLKTPTHTICSSVVKKALPIESKTKLTMKHKISSSFHAEESFASFCVILSNKLFINL